MYSGLDRVRLPQVIDELFLARSEENPSGLTDQRRMLMQKLDPDPASRPALIFNAAIARDCMDRLSRTATGKDDVWRKRRQFDPRICAYRPYCPRPAIVELD